jgi:hypothetical protein
MCFRPHGFYRDHPWLEVFDFILLSPILVPLLVLGYICWAIEGFPTKEDTLREMNIELRLHVTQQEALNAIKWATPSEMIEFKQRATRHH